VNLNELLDLDEGRAWVGFTANSGAVAVDGGHHYISSWQFTPLVDLTTTVAIEEVSTAEGDAGTTEFVFTVTRRGDTSGEVVVNWNTADGAATAASGDYVAASGSLTFPAGDTNPQTISVQVAGDFEDEGNEQFFVNLRALFVEV
jgi:hypothetical protein